MLVVAMAFAWCVISADGEKVHGLRASRDRTPRPRLRSSRPPRSRARTPIRSAIPAEVIAFAKTLVNLPMGTEQVEEIDGQRYVFVLERHYHPQGFVGAPDRLAQGRHRVRAALRRPPPDRGPHAGDDEVATGALRAIEGRVGAGERALEGLAGLHGDDPDADGDA